MSDIVQKLWGFCHTLRHDGFDCRDSRSQCRKSSPSAPKRQRPGPSGFPRGAMSRLG